MKKFAYMLAWRYMRRTPYEASVATMTKISLLAIALGTFALAMVLAVMTGFEQETHKQLQGIHASLTMHANGQPLDHEKIMAIFSKEFDAIQAASPSTTRHAMIKNQESDDISQIIMIKAIIPNHEAATTSLATKITKSLHTPAALPTLLTNRHIILGEKLAEQLDIAVGDIVTILYMQDHEQKKSLHLDQIPLKVAGFFKTGIEEIDLSMVVCSFETLELLYPDAQPTEISIALKPYYEQYDQIQQLKQRFHMQVYSWQQLYPALVSALTLEKYASFIVITLIILVASMTILALLFMQITQKRSDIAMLYAMGCSYRAIRTTFFVIGMILATIGTLIGLLSAYMLGIFLQKYPCIQLPDAYFVSSLPVVLTWYNFLMVGVIVLIVSACAAWYAVRSLKNLRIANVIRFEG